MYNYNPFDFLPKETYHTLTKRELWEKYLESKRQKENTPVVQSARTEESEVRILPGERS